jgi:hypothetical protein
MIMALKQIVFLLVLVSHTISEKSRFPMPVKHNSVKPNPKPNPKSNPKPNPGPNPKPNPGPNPEPDQCECLSKAEVVDLKKAKDKCLSKSEIIELIEDDCRDNPCKNGQCIDLVNDYRLFFVRSN